MVSLNMPFIFGIILSVLIGYALGGLVIFLIPIMAAGFFIYILGKPALQKYIKRQRERRKLKKLLKERLKYLP
jgi:Flp pilus assembly protein TadB